IGGGDGAATVDETRGDEASAFERGELSVVELGPAFAVRVRDGDARAGHAAEEDRGAVLDTEQDEARLELLGAVAHETRPRGGAGEQVGEVGEHLAAVAHAEDERVAARREARERVAGARVVAERRGPAAAGAEDVAEREAAARDSAAAVGEID